jgi:REP element-mobilizing transposase RayT
MRHSLRIPYHDYSSAAYYFATICSHKRENLFAFDTIRLPATSAPTRRQTVQSTARRTVIGKIIRNNWLKISGTNIRTDAFVIMPNHIHGIILLGPRILGRDKNRSDEAGRSGQETHPPSLGTIIGAFKSRCAVDYLKYIKENDRKPAAKIWQRGYFDHIIRDRRELFIIRNYIKQNPLPRK